MSYGARVIQTHGVNVKGRKIYQGVKGGFYVMDAKGKKIYKFAKVPSPKPVVAHGVNTLGRKIHQGARGGFYVMDAKGKKIYKFAKAVVAPKAPSPKPVTPAPKAPSPKPVHGVNTLGRKIYQGSRGGLYVTDAKGKKIYKFKMEAKR
jgi:hypothetical protein